MSPLLTSSSPLPFPAVRLHRATVREVKAPAASAAGALPCLSSDNSDEISVKACGTDRKRAERTRQNIAHFASRFGSSVGVLTITFAHDLDTRAAQRKLGNFKRRVLRENFGESVTVREFTARGRPHFHLVIDCRGDITSGFNWLHYDEVTAWSKSGRQSAKPYGSLNRSPRLVALHRILAEKAPLYGLGRIELVPVKKPEAIGFYLGGYLSKSLAHKPADAKGTRSVNYSHRCPQILSGKWSWNNPSGWLWRQKLRTWAKSHGCETMAEVYSLFGPKWAYHNRKSILSTPLSYYPTSEHARRDGHVFPPDFTDIRITASGLLRSVRINSPSADLVRQKEVEDLTYTLEEDRGSAAKRSAERVCGGASQTQQKGHAPSINTGGTPHGAAACVALSVVVGVSPVVSGCDVGETSPAFETSEARSADRPEAAPARAGRVFRLRSYAQLRDAGKLPRQDHQRSLKFHSL